jgi:hypothetical protein
MFVYSRHYRRTEAWGQSPMHRSCRCLAVSCYASGQCHIQVLLNRGNVSECGRTARSLWTEEETNRNPTDRQKRRGPVTQFRYPHPVLRPTEAKFQLNCEMPPLPCQLGDTDTAQYRANGYFVVILSSLSAPRLPGSDSCSMLITISMCFPSRFIPQLSGSRIVPQTLRREKLSVEIRT